MKLTKQQQNAIDSLRKGFFVISNCRDFAGKNFYSTGISCRVLQSLKDKGLINFDKMCLGGFVQNLEVLDDLHGFVPAEDQDKQLAEELRKIKLYGRV